MHYTLSYFYCIYCAYKSLVLGSQAEWFFIGATGKFGDEYSLVETSEPDRSQCVHSWIVDVDETSSSCGCSGNGGYDSNPDSDGDGIPDDVDPD